MTDTRSNALKKFDFLLGNWDMKSHIPASKFSEPGTDTGSGTFKKILNDQFICLEYSSKTGGAAKGIFAWDEKISMFRYWWFENSGNFAEATCDFINDEVLAMNWHDSLLVQTFVREEPEKVVLKMEYPAQEGGHEVVLEVVFTRETS